MESGCGRSGADLPGTNRGAAAALSPVVEALGLKEYMMKVNVHGLLSLSLAGLAVVLSIGAMWQQSWLAASAYVIILSAIALNVIKGFCAICPSRESCGHLIPGFIAKTLFPNISPRPFTKAGFMVLAAEIALIILIPQYWLFRKVEIFALYWLLFIVAGIEIFNFVCKKCLNEYCPSNKHFKGFA